MRDGGFDSLTALIGSLKTLYLSLTCTHLQSSQVPLITKHTAQKAKCDGDLGSFRSTPSYPLM